MLNVVATKALERVAERDRGKIASAGRYGTVERNAEDRKKGGGV